MTFIPIRSKKHPGAVFIAERTPGVRDARFIAKVYPGPEAEREADLILTALRATVFREPTPGPEWRCGASPDCTVDDPCAVHRPGPWGEADPPPMRHWPRDQGIPGTEWDDIDEDYDGQVEDLLS